MPCNIPHGPTPASARLYDDPVFPSADQIRDDLRGEFRGAMLFDSPSRALYATDASPFQIAPHGITIPADADDLAALLKYTHANNLPVMARGAGTGLAGESLGPGLMIDLARNFQAVGELADNRIRVGVGVTLARLNAALGKVGRRIGPDPASAASATVGGMIATNASGSNASVHGYFREAVHSLKVLWDDGSPAELGPGRVISDELRTTEIRSQTSALLSAHQELIQVKRPQTGFDRAGYVLHDVTTAAGLHLKRLLIGSEGTLAITTEAELKTIPLAGGTAFGVLAFETLNEALRAGLSLRSTEGVVSCDVLDQRWLSLSRAAIARTGIAVPLNAAALAMIGVEAGSIALARVQLDAAIHRIQQTVSVEALIDSTAPPEAVARFRAAALSGIYAGAGPARPLAFLEDTAVPAESLLRYVSGVAELLRRQDVTGVFSIQPLAGQVHARPILDPDSPADRQKMWALADSVFHLAIGLGGTISTRHGVGLARTPWIAKQSGDLVPVFAELKRIFDPKNLLNPGKITGADPSRAAWPLREPAPVRQPLLLWQPATAEREAGRCHGCGDCRTDAAPVRMCPTFHATGRESASPRAKANLFRGELSTVEARAVAETCVNCKMCRSECPSQVNIPKLALEAKAAYYAEHGLDRDEWILARIEALMTLGGNFAFTTNRILGNSAARWAIEKLFGLSRKRTLPKFTHRTFLRRAKTYGWSRRPNADSDKPKIAYFVDTFANHNDPLIGEAAVAVLQHHGFDVYVPPRQRGSGVAALVQGDVETAREIASSNIRLLVDLARSGYTILCSEPTAALTLAQDYLDLFGDVDTRLVAAHTVELTSFLWQLHEAGSLRTDFPHRLDLQLGHHVPCHVKALGGEAAGPKLLGLIPGLEVFTIDAGCSGMAGTYGLQASNYADSMKAGRSMFEELKRPRVLFGSTECGACRMQMQEGSRKRALHPIQYLALAYGLLPEVWAKLQRPLTRLATE